MNSELKFHEVKKEIQQLIHQRKKVTSQTNYKIPGIYMIYINHFTDDKIIPIYIGQSTDIQKRYKDHYTEILALNRLSYDEYNHYFFSKSYSFYEGKFKTSKIFKYMVENSCTLEDFNMIILEEVEFNDLIQKEDEYFQQYLPAFFGFNQFSSFLKRILLSHQKEPLSDNDIHMYCELIEEDLQYIQQYKTCGFTNFNFEHSFARNVKIPRKEIKPLNRDTKLKVKETERNLREIWKNEQQTSKKMANSEKKSNKKYEVLRNARIDLYESVAMLKLSIEKKFSQLNFYSLKAQENFIDSILKDSNLHYKNEFLKYLSRKHCGIDFYNFYQKEIKQIQKKQAYKDKQALEYEEAFNDYAVIRDEKIKKRYQQIFPQVIYSPFTLQDKNVQFSFVKNEDYKLENTCHIRFIIANNRITRGGIRKDPYIIRVDYQYTDKELNQHKKSYYINNEITRQAQTGTNYIEADMYNRFVFKPERFKISSINIIGEMDNTIISTLAEFKHGVNDFTLQGKELLPLIKVLTDIEQLTDEQTKFKIESTETHPCLEDCMKTAMVHNNSFAQKIIDKKLPILRKLGKNRKRKMNVKYKTTSRNTTISRADKYMKKIRERSNNQIIALTYTSSKEEVLAKCNLCDYEWRRRSDHLLARPYCPRCKKNSQ